MATRRPETAPGPQNGEFEEIYWRTPLPRELGFENPVEALRAVWPKEGIDHIADELGLEETSRLIVKAFADPTHESTPSYKEVMKATGLAETRVGKSRINNSRRIFDYLWNHPDLISNPEIADQARLNQERQEAVRGKITETIETILDDPGEPSRVERDGEMYVLVPDVLDILSLTHDIRGETANQGLQSLLAQKRAEIKPVWPPGLGPNSSRSPKRGIRILPES